MKFHFNKPRLSYRTQLSLSIFFLTKKIDLKNLAFSTKIKSYSQSRPNTRIIKCHANLKFHGLIY